VKGDDIMRHLPVANHPDPVLFLDIKPEMAGTFIHNGCITKLHAEDAVVLNPEPMELPKKGKLVLAAHPTEDECYLGQWRKRGGRLMVVPLNRKCAPFDTELCYEVKRIDLKA
jgi:hypothetical protein